MGKEKLEILLMMMDAARPYSGASNKLSLAVISTNRDILQRILGGDSDLLGMIVLCCEQGDDFSLKIARDLWIKVAEAVKAKLQDSRQLSIN